MAKFNVFEDLIEPLGRKLQSDMRFGNLTIYYDRSIDRVVPRSNMPAISYFLEPPWDNVARGSGTGSLQQRTLTARMAMAVWVYDSSSPERLDRALFSISGDLFDFLWENRDFDRTKGIVIDSNVNFDIDYQGDENNIVGTQKLAVDFRFDS